MACEDLRHVCGACGFKWPERPAYDALTLANANLRDALQQIRLVIDQREPADGGEAVFQSAIDELARIALKP